jgi:hypothetical protein
MAIDVNELTEEDIFDLSDEEFEAAYRDASKQASSGSETEDVPDTDVGEIENENVDDGEPSEDNNSNAEEIEAEEENEPDDGSVDEVDEKEPETAVDDEGQPDEDPEANTADTKGDSSDTQIIDLKPVKIDGTDVPVKSLDELYALASAGGRVTQKFQEIAKHKKSIMMMEENKIDEKDLSLLAEIKNGSKDALAALVNASGIDPMDLPSAPSENYQPGAYIPSDTKVSIMEIDRELSVDPEYNITRDIVNNQLDPRSQDTLLQNPDMIRAIHHDVKVGAFPRVNAIAKKLKAMDGGMRSDIEYYIAAANEPEFLNTVGQQPMNQVPQQQQQQYPNQQQMPQQQAPKKPANRSKKKAASSSASSKKPSKVDIWEDMSDEELMAYREQVLSRM